MKLPFKIFFFSLTGLSSITAKTSVMSIKRFLPFPLDGGLSSDLLFYVRMVCKAWQSAEQYGPLFLTLMMVAASFQQA